MQLPDELKSLSAYVGYLQLGRGEYKFLSDYFAYRYHKVEIPKKNGKLRELAIPENRLKYLQHMTLLLFERCYAPRKPVHGFTSGRSVISNARSHERRPYMLNIDLENYFGSITKKRIAGMLSAIGIDQSLTAFLCKICTFENSLPQGAPTSPIIANMITLRLDRSMMSFAKQNRLRYTRYADDITLSSYVKPIALFKDGLPDQGRINADILSHELLACVHSNGFALNTEKVWYSGPRGRKEVTGLVVNEFTNVRRKFLRNIRSSLFKVSSLGAVQAEQDYQQKYRLKGSLSQVLRGRLEWLAQVRGRSFGPYRKLANQFNELFPSETPLPISPDYIEIVEKSVWIIEYLFDEGMDQGTAFFLDGLGLVTAHHVLKALPAGARADLYRPGGGKKFSAWPTARSCEHRDLMILSHDVPDAQHLNLTSAASPEKTDDDVIAYGFPAYSPGDSLSKRKGHLIGRATRSGVKLVEVSAILSSGMSGCPLTNDRYQVIGIAHKGGGDEPKQLAVDVTELLNLASQTTD